MMNEATSPDPAIPAAGPAPADLAEAARSIIDNAHSPYSNFAVAAALRSSEGEIVTGTNCESASYGLTMCAERTAVFHAASQGILRAGAAPRRIVECVVYTPTDRPTAPCGACRQVLREFADPGELRIWSVCDGDATASWTLEELLPDSFGPEDLSA